MTRVFGIVGYSGSGKTTLLEALIAHLAQRSVRVNAIKHSHHDIAVEPPQKDSARLRAAGAQEVMIASPYRFAIIHELRGQDEPDVLAQLHRLAPADLSLIEGFREHPFPKLEVWRAATGKPMRYAMEDGIIAVACDVPPPQCPLPCLNLADVGGIAAFILENARPLET